MSLRTDYTGALDTALSASRLAGFESITITSLASITTQMATAAAAGLKTFTITLAVAHQPTDMRSEGPLWDAYRSGILQGLYSEDLMGSDIEVVIDLSDTLVTSVSLNFDFCG